MLDMFSFHMPFAISQSYTYHFKPVFFQKLPMRQCQQNVSALFFHLVLKSTEYDCRSGCPRSVFSAQGTADTAQSIRNKQALIPNRFYARSFAETSTQITWQDDCVAKATLSSVVWQIFAVENVEVGVFFVRVCARVHSTAAASE